MSVQRLLKGLCYNHHHAIEKYINLNAFLVFVFLDSREADGLLTKTPTVIHDRTAVSINCLATAPTTSYIE